MVERPRFGAGAGHFVEHTKADSITTKVARSYDRDRACLFLTWSIEDAATVHVHLTSPDVRLDLPDDAHWEILVLPTGDAGLRLFVGPNADPSCLPIGDTSPDAVEQVRAPDTDEADTNPYSSTDFSDI